MRRDKWNTYLEVQSETGKTIIFQVRNLRHDWTHRECVPLVLGGTAYLPYRILGTGGEALFQLAKAREGRKP